jgi:hypothetical protein
MPLLLKNPLIDPTKLKIKGDQIHYFIYQQDGKTKQPMSCKNTRTNQLIVSWMQIHDSPLTGKSVEEIAARRSRPHDS